jgi:uncharacterized caspase-like protein
MAKNWALVIGINHYNFLQPLRYAKQDAKSIQNFLCTQAGFEQVFLFSDDSPNIGGTSTRPYRANLLRCLQQFSEQPFMEQGNNFWFFFRGYGITHASSDYLMPTDGNPEDIDNTAISINCITEYLRHCGCDNIILILDACRHNYKQTTQAIGRQTQEIAVQSEVVSIFSCRPHEDSYEIDALQTGVFTHALLEGLGTQGQCATVERLSQYLSFRVPQLAHQYANTQQTPYTTTQSTTKLHLILMPKYATLYDITTLKLDASQAHVDRDFELAEQLPIHVDSNDNCGDMNAIGSSQRLVQGKFNSHYHTQNHSTSQNFLGEIIRYPNEGLGTLDYAEERLTLHQETSTTLTTLIPHRDTTHFASLNYEKKVDYQYLQDLLIEGKWKQADRETIALMLKVANRETEGWLDIESINKFPCADLCIIDQLWLKYSNGRFGFSMQKHVWESVGGQPSSDYETWCKFCDHIGWRTDHNWLFYSDLNFSNNAPLGHLPAAGIVHVLTPWKGWVVGLFCCLVGFSALAYKLEQNHPILPLYNTTSDGA